MKFSDEDEEAFKAYQRHPFRRVHELGESALYVLRIFAKIEKATCDGINRLGSWCKAGDGFFSISNHRILFSTEMGSFGIDEREQRFVDGIKQLVDFGIIIESEMDYGSEPQEHMTMIKEPPKEFIDKYLSRPLNLMDENDAKIYHETRIEGVRLGYFKIEMKVPEKGKRWDVPHVNFISKLPEGPCDLNVVCLP